MTSRRPALAATSRWRRWVAPLSLAIIVLSAAGAIAHVALPTRDDAAHDAVAQVRAPVAAASVPALAAPAPTASPAPYVSPIEIVLPPPPPPPVATVTMSGSSSQRIEAVPSADVTTPAAWCDGGYGATASASNVSGLLAAANAERARWGLGALTWSGSLATDAQAWSYTQASSGGLSHGMVPSPGGQNVFSTYNSRGLSESSAAGQAHAAWMASTGHCSNILSANWSTMGAGAASVDGGSTWYLTANFQ